MLALIDRCQIFTPIQSELNSTIPIAIYACLCQPEIGIC